MVALTIFLCGIHLKAARKAVCLADFRTKLSQVCSRWPGSHWPSGCVSPRTVTCVWTCRRSEAAGRAEHAAERGAARLPASAGAGGFRRPARTGRRRAGSRLQHRPQLAAGRLLQRLRHCKTAATRAKTLLTPGIHDQKNSKVSNG